MIAAFPGETDENLRSRRSMTFNSILPLGFIHGATRENRRGSHMVHDTHSGGPARVALDFELALHLGNCLYY